MFTHHTPAGEDSVRSTPAAVLGNTSSAQTKGSHLKTLPARNNVVQAKIGGIDKVKDFEDSLSASIYPYSLYSKSNLVQGFVQINVLDSTNNFKSYKTGKAQQLSTSTTKGVSKLTNNQGRAKWIVHLYDSFSDHSDTGYESANTPAKHAAAVSKTEKHDKNWEKFVTDQLKKIDVTINTSVDLLFNSKYYTALAAAKELDMEESNSDTLKVNLTQEFADIKDFADYVESKRDHNTSKVKASLPIWQTESKYGTGTQMHAEFVPYGTHPRGSGSPIKTPIEWFYSGRVGQDNSSRYVKGHLLNDHVGGPAKNYNLSPLVDKDNGSHEKGIESDLKAEVTAMQREVTEGVTPTYEKVIYDVVLESQSSRSGTGTWSAAAQYLESCPAKNATFGDITNKRTVNTDDNTSTHDFKNAPGQLRNLIDTVNIGENKTIKSLLPQFQFNALLWEAEDYLVRPWYVRLQVNYVDNTQTLQSLNLPNKKETNLDAGLRLDTSDKGKAGYKYDTTTSKPGGLFDTQNLHKDYPLRLEKKLVGMSSFELGSMLQYLEAKKETTLASALKNLSHDAQLNAIAQTHAATLASILLKMEQDPSGFMQELLEAQQKLKNEQLFEEGKKEGVRHGKFVRDYSPGKDESAYEKGYREGLQEGLKEEGRRRGWIQGRKDGHKLYRPYPNVKFTAYDSSTLNYAYKNGYKYGYWDGYDFGAESLGKSDGLYDKKKNRGYRPSSNLAAYKEGYYRGYNSVSGFKRKSNSRDRDHVKKKKY